MYPTESQCARCIEFLAQAENRERKKISLTHKNSRFMFMFLPLVYCPERQTICRDAAYFIASAIN